MKLWRRLFGFLRPYKALLALALVAMVLLAATTGLYPILIDLLSTTLFGGDQALELALGPRFEQAARLLAAFGIELDPSALRGGVETNLFALFGAVVLIKAASQAVRFWAMGALAQRVIHDLREHVFGAIVRQSQAFFGEQATGFLVSRVINDVDHVERAATYAIPILIGDVLKVLVLGSVCLWQYPDLTLVTAVVLPLAAFPIVGFGKLLKRLASQGQQALGALTNRVTETLGGMRIVQIYGREDHERERFRRESASYVAVMMRSVAVRALQTPVMELVGVAALLGTMAWAQRQIASGEIRPGEVIAFLLALVLIYEPLKAIGRLNGIVMPGLASAERVFEIADRPCEVQDAPDALAIQPMQRAVSIEGVSFRYPGAKDLAVRDLDLVLPRGKVVALVGESGSGKSTVAALLPRLYDVTAGRIAIDGTDIRRATLDSLRAQIAVVTQETYLFNDTIRANIAYGKPGASDDEIIAAARAAHAHEFIQNLEGGYGARAGERGALLSGGQRQRIAIARAFLRDAPILILDEATSALDSASEREVQSALDGLLSQRTALVIAHRLSTVRRADEIVVLDGGRIVERGTHESLLTRGGVYARLAYTADEAA